ncbi:MAG: DUF2278 family protein [Bacilli bacterium]
MAVANYGVLKGKVIQLKEERDDQTPHFQLLMQSNERLWRIAVNVLSSSKESELLYCVDNDFRNKNTESLHLLPVGWHELEGKSKELRVDYVQSNFFNPAEMKIVPHHVEGENNDLNDWFASLFSKAQRENADVYVFGSRFGPEKKKDKIFGFEPAKGVHNVHMNQGNEKLSKWNKDNGAFHDGAIFIAFKESWTAIFLAFQSQSWCNDSRGVPLAMCTHKDIVKRKEGV